MNLMLMNVAMRKYGRAVRLPESAVSVQAGTGISKSAVSRRFVALTEAKLEEWMSSDLSQLDLLVIQIDGLHLDENLLMVGAVGVDINGDKHPLGVIEGATENATVVQALLDNLTGRGLDPKVCRLFVVDGAKALACTNMIESMNSVIRQVCRNVKRWRNASIARRWTGAAMFEARKGFRRLKAHKQLPILKEALRNYRSKTKVSPVLDRLATAAQ